MSLLHAKERLSQALEEMAISPAPLQQRLANAYFDQLNQIEPETDLPAKLRPLYQEIRITLNRFVPPGSPSRELKPLNIDEAVQVARQIVQLDDQVSEALVEGEFSAAFMYEEQPQARTWHL